MATENSSNNAIIQISSTTLYTSNSSILSNSFSLSITSGLSSSSNLSSSSISSGLPNLSSSCCQTTTATSVNNPTVTMTNNSTMTQMNQSTVTANFYSYLISVSTASSDFTSLTVNSDTHSSTITSWHIPPQQLKCCCKCCATQDVNQCNSCVNDSAQQAAACAGNLPISLLQTTSSNFSRDIPNFSAAQPLAGSKFTERLEYSEIFKESEIFRYRALATLSDSQQIDLGFKLSDLILSCQFNETDCNMQT